METWHLDEVRNVLALEFPAWPTEDTVFLAQLRSHYEMNDSLLVFLEYSANTMVYFAPSQLLWLPE